MDEQACKVPEENGGRHSTKDEVFSPTDQEKVEAMMAEVMKFIYHPKSLELARKACEQYFEYQGKLSSKPTFIKADAQVENFYFKAQALLYALDKMDSVVRRDLDFATHSCPAFTAHTHHGVDLDNWREMLNGLICLTDNPGGWLDIPIKAYRPTNKTYLRNSFIRTMATAYEKEKLTPARDAVHSDYAHDNQNGKFYDMIWYCLIAAGHPPESGIDLENAIREKLKDRPPRTTPWPA